MNIDFIQLASSLKNFLPEIVLGTCFVLAIAAEAVAGRPTARRAIGGFAFVGFGLAGWMAYQQLALTDNDFRGEWLFKAGHQAFGQGMVVVDSFAIFFKVLIAIAAMLVVVFSLLSRELISEGKPRLGEYYSLLLAMTFGMYLMVGANDLLLMYLAIEIVSLSSYAIVGFIKRVPRAAEASMKYVIYGGISSGIMLFGISLVYGLTGSTNFSEIYAFLGAPNAETAPLQAFTMAAIMILAGLGYKISAAPFHFWTPDVYEGAPITMTAYLSVASKAAGFALLLRFLITAFPVPMQGFDWRTLVAIISVATMSLGNLAALQQTNLKRLLAYSSIAHAGYMLMGVVVSTTYGVAAILIYFAVYLLMNLGGFFAIQKIAEQIGSEEIEDYRGLGPRMPFVGVLLGVFMISLVGLPPTAGFVGKLFLFSSLLQQGSEWLWLAVIGVLNSVVSLYYYVRVLKVMYLDKAPEGERGHVSIEKGSVAIMGVLALATLLFGLPNFFGTLANIAENSLGTLAQMLKDGGSLIGGL
ncbi:MAG: NADH-quinone oxidoreductase subunit N [bacterium]|nr:NADH-quinone oxidoreductase subunit N [Candidatus Kapabacteria bacterium]